jgi:outer membrane protein TolC
MRRRGIKTGGGALRRHFGPRLAVLMLTFSAGTFAHAQQAASPIGANVESVLDVAHSLSPTLRAAALDTAAASARADRSDSLANPMVTLQTMQVPSSRARMDQATIMLQQEFPLWGKRSLRKSAAIAMLDAARGTERATAAALDEQIEIAFANFYRATRALAINNEVTRLDSEMARIAANRLGQGIGTQTEALTAQAEATQTAVERLRLQRDLATVKARLNALLARAPDAPLVEPLALRPLPSVVPSIDALLDRVETANPVLRAQGARVASAEAEQELARKEWYPDVTLGAGAQTNMGSWGYAASIGIRIPLQWGALESAEREATANLGAARQRLAVNRAEVGGDLAQAVAALSAAAEIGTARRDQLVPQLTASYRSALTAYANGRSDLAPALAAVHRLHDTELELLDSDVEGQAALAMIERLLGSAL